MTFHVPALRGHDDHLNILALLTKAATVEAARAASGSAARRQRPTEGGIFPDRNVVIRLVGAVLAGQHDEWAEGRRYLGLDVLARAQALGTTTEEVTAEQTLQAIAA